MERPALLALLVYAVVAKGRMDERPLANEMTPILQDRLLTVYHADVLAGLREIPDASIHCVVTSPPYWGLRDYHIHPSQWDAVTFAPMAGLPEKTVPAMECCHGLEPDPWTWVAHEVAVWREIKRVLRKDGTAWVNVGDTSSTDTKWGGSSSNKNEKDIGDSKRGHKWSSGLKPKDICGLPWRLAFALQAQGWYLRSDIIWAKPAPMPESVHDRPTRSHEYLFLLTQSARYFYDAEAVKEPCSKSTHARVSQDLANQIGSYRANGGGKTNGPMRAVLAGSTRKLAKVSGWAEGPGSHSPIDHNQSDSHPKTTPRTNESWESACILMPITRNKRDVWTIPSAQFSDYILDQAGNKITHFAVFPEALVTPCILAGTSERGACAQCGAPWQRVISPNGELSSGGSTRKHAEIRAGQGRNGTLVTGNFAQYQTTGWHATCKCGHPETVPCTVLDPFAGTGTTGVAANHLGRRAILIEISGDSCQLIRKRINAISIGLL